MKNQAVNFRNYLQKTDKIKYYYLNKHRALETEQKDKRTRLKTR